MNEFLLADSSKCPPRQVLGPKHGAGDLVRVAHVADRDLFIGTALLPRVVCIIVCATSPTVGTVAFGWIVEVVAITLMGNSTDHLKIMP